MHLHDHSLSTPHLALRTALLLRKAVNMGAWMVMASGKHVHGKHIPHEKKSKAHACVSVNPVSSAPWTHLHQNFHVVSVLLRTKVPYGTHQGTHGHVSAWMKRQQLQSRKCIFKKEAFLFLYLKFISFWQGVPPHLHSFHSLPLFGSFSEKFLCKCL